MSGTMRAITQSELGGTEVLRLVEMPRPEPGYGEVLVRVKAAGVNPVDPAARSRALYIGQSPFILGWDVSGVVEQVGIGVARFSVGDEVYGMPRFPGIAGTHAQYITAPSRHLDHKPEGLSHVEAAALPLTGLTAWQALVDIADVRAGQTVLVHAAAGGIGHLAAQIAVLLGAKVIGTASAAKHEFVKALGADRMIDYTTEDFTREVKDVDVVLNSMPGDYAARSVSVLRDGGTLAELHLSNARARFADAEARGISTRFMLVEPDLAGLRGLSRLVSRGELKAHIAQVLPLDAAAEAHRLGKTGRTTGKIVLRMD